MVFIWWKFTWWTYVTTPFTNQLLSFLLVLSEIFEKAIYNATNLENDLTFSNQSCFKAGDNYINQLNSINHVFKGFDDRLELREFYFYIPKTFDKVWHEGVMNKICCNDISDKFLQLLLRFLDSKKQQILLNDQCSSWGFISTEVLEVEFSDLWLLLSI